MTKLFATLKGSEDALEDLKQCYDDVDKKIDKNFRAMFGLVENDDDEYYDEDEIYDLLELTPLNPYEDADGEDEYDGYDNEQEF